MRFSEAVINTAQQLERANLWYGQGFQNAEDEALRMVFAALGLDFQTYIATEDHAHDLILNNDAISTLQEITFERIHDRKPLAYILQETWFSGHRFYIDERAIIPRSYFAEWIPYQFRPWVDPDQIRTMLDLCCGSGCIAICCALVFPNASVLASDISADALEVASRNISDYSLRERVRLHQGNMFEGIDQKFDLIVCNPPYVSTDRLRMLPPEYCMEPDIAFHGGIDGLDFLLELLIESVKYLAPNGIIIVESGTASERLEELLERTPFTWLSTEFDEQALFLLEASQLRLERNNFIQLLEIRQQMN
ncbi:MAG: 50S ribosomal protein L3 N(5)-glutamine methyltransferase [Gammaproteobacteria bacterium]|nr:50S ribosomal protein L3 N(5)-glutamine methyltransferase [Gammaproteobacteria bacterium]MCY4275956.1 50S ribosomal protein L3 N(5)-glutamine methyltransferase [Gammaproteobacteria bacterium]